MRTGVLKPGPGGFWEVRTSDDQFELKDGEIVEVEIEGEWKRTRVSVSPTNGVVPKVSGIIFAENMSVRVKG